MDTRKIAISIICLIAVFFIGAMTGYYLSDAHSDANVPSDDNAQNPVVFGMADNNSTAVMKKNTIFSIQLDENPTTGYMWDISSSQGLTITESTFTPRHNINPFEPFRCGEDGVHEWHFVTAMEGMQGFRAVDCCPWINLTGDEQVYILHINVTGE